MVNFGFIQNIIIAFLFPNLVIFLHSTHPSVYESKPKYLNLLRAAMKIKLMSLT